MDLSLPPLLVQKHDIYFERRTGGGGTGRWDPSPAPSHLPFGAAGYELVNGTVGQESPSKNAAAAAAGDCIPSSFLGFFLKTCCSIESRDAWSLGSTHSLTQVGSCEVCT